jgi:anti-sigma factor RsiW
MAASAFSAYRTYARAAETEFAAVDPGALERWLRPQLGGWIAVPDLAAGGFALIGGRVVPGAQGPAGFALYKNSAGARIGLMLESGEGSPTPVSRASGALDALALPAPAPEQAVLVAGGGAADLARLATLARFSVAPPR